MTLNGAIMQLVQMRESEYMPTMFKPLFDKVIETVSECEEPGTPSAQPEYTEQDVRDAFNDGYRCGMESAQRKPGKWVCEERERLWDETDDGPVYITDKWWTCSECGHIKGYIGHRPDDNYCPACGARMNGGKAE